MDLIIGRGARFSYLLVPRSSKFFPQQHQLAAHWPIRYSQKHSASFFQSSCTSVLALDRGAVRLKSPSTSFHPAKVDTVQYGTSAKSDSSAKTTMPDEHCSKQPAQEKPSVFQRMKQMTKDYWHILIPVHLVTSIGWASIFYIAAKNGVDIVGILESLNMSEKYLEMLRGSSAGHWAVTYALYKIFTPVRYTVTVGGTTMCIRYLNKWGYMKFKDSKLTQSLKNAQEHITSYGKSKISSKVNQPPPPKT